MSLEHTEVQEVGQLSKAIRQVVSLLIDAAGQVTALEKRLRQVELAISRNTNSLRQLADTELEAVPGRSFDWGGTSHVSTATAASWLNRTPQTLRKWACYEDGPIRPIRINGRLAWSVVEIRKLLGD